MVIKDRYVSMYITKYQKFGIADISVRKKVSPNVITILDSRQLCAFEIQYGILSYSMKFGSITKLHRIEYIIVFFQFY